MPAGAHGLDSIRRWLFGAALFAGLTPAYTLEIAPALQDKIHTYLVLALQSHPHIQAHFEGTKPAQIFVQLGKLDPRLRLAPCTHVEPYLPAGFKLASTSRVGLRCTQGPVAWRVSLPIRTQVLGRGLVALRTIAAGAMLDSKDFGMSDIDLLKDTSDPIVDEHALHGRMSTRTLERGQSIRVAHLKPRQWFAAGEAVKVVARGTGYTVATQGQALTVGVEGQSAKVRMDTGQVVTGTATGQRQVSVEL